MSFEVRPLRPDEVDEALRQRHVSFGAPSTDPMLDAYRQRVAAGELWGVDEGGRLLGHGRFLAVDHWFGGRRVPCQHVASVTVPPEHRGRAVASALVSECAARGAEAGLGLSLLFPATTRLYRKLGWEYAGTYTTYRVAAWQAMPPGGRAPAMRPVSGEADWEAVRRCHEHAARAANGVGVRTEEVWRLLRDAPFRYVLDGEAPGTADAYALYTHERVPGDWRFTLAFQDWAATTPQGLAAVVGLVASHGTLGRDATFRFGVPEPWSLLVGEQHVERDRGMQWMARALDLPRAVAERGFPSGPPTAMTLAVDDPVLPGTGGTFRLEVAGGRGRLERTTTAGRPDVHLHGRAVGPVFTGFHRPVDLAVAGLAAGRADALDLLGQLFAGAVPWMVDFF